MNHTIALVDDDRNILTSLSIALEIAASITGSANGVSLLVSTISINGKLNMKCLLITYQNEMLSFKFN